MREKYDSDPETYIKELDHSIEPLTVAIKNIRKGLQALTQNQRFQLNLMSKPVVGPLSRDSWLCWRCGSRCWWIRCNSCISVGKSSGKF